LPFVTSSALYLGLSGPYCAHQAIIIASEYPEVSEQGTAGKGQPVTFVIPRKLETIRRLQIGENQREITVLHNIVLSAICDIRKQRNNYNATSSESVKDLFK